MVAQSSRPKPLVLLLPWLGATSGGTAKYSKLYKDLGMDVMVHEVKMQDFLWPRTGLASSKDLLDVLNKLVAGDSGLRPLIVHSFSVGCYFYALMVVNMRSNEKLYGPVLKSVVAQIIDSPVIGSLNEMAYGVSKMLSPNSKPLSLLYRNICLAYFALSRPYTVDIYKKSLHAIKHLCPIALVLVVSCKNDPMHTPQAINDLVDSQRELRSVTFKLWNESSHALHLKVHPLEYKSLITNLLKQAFACEDIKSKL